MKNWSDIAPAGRPFIKMQGLKNHFVIIDGRAKPFKPSVDEIKYICDRIASIHKLINKSKLI